MQLLIEGEFPCLGDEVTTSRYDYMFMSVFHYDVMTWLRHFIYEIKLLLIIVTP